MPGVLRRTSVRLRAPCSWNDRDGLRGIQQRRGELRRRRFFVGLSFDFDGFQVAGVVASRRLIVGECRRADDDGQAAAGVDDRLGQWMPLVLATRVDALVHADCLPSVVVETPSSATPCRKWAGCVDAGQGEVTVNNIHSH